MAWTAYKQEKDNAGRTILAEELMLTCLAVQKFPSTFTSRMQIWSLRWNKLPRSTSTMANTRFDDNREREKDIIINYNVHLLACPPLFLSGRKRRSYPMSCPSKSSEQIVNATIKQGLRLLYMQTYELFPAATFPHVDVISWSSFRPGSPRYLFSSMMFSQQPGIV